MNIQKSNNTNAKHLTDLTIRSKSHWDYSPEQIELWRHDLAITSDYIQQNEVYQLNDDEKLIGYYSYFALNEKTVKLDNIFIDSTYIGKGFGKILMNDFLNRVNQNGFKRVVLDADPNATSFYQKIGFKIIGQLETSIKNRFLPIMELEL